MLTKNIDLNESNIHDALEKAEMNWNVEQSEIMNLSTTKTIPGYKNIYRSDNQTSLGVVGDSYSIFQNYDSFSFFDVICEKHNAKIIKAYEFNNGKKVILEATIDEDFEVRKGDVCKRLFKLTNGFDGKTSTIIEFQVRRLVCKNGLTALDGDMSNRIMLKHTKNIHSRVEEAFKIFGFSEIYFKKFQEKAKAMVQKIADKEMVEQYLDKLFKDQESKQTEHKKEKIKELFEAGKGNGKGTTWDLYNGAIEFSDHFSKKNVEDIIEYANIGSGVNFKERAFSIAMNMV
jgi:phage/plasmid-like protein (TIGR03299 family)